MKGVLHEIETDLQSAWDLPRWFVVSAIAVRVGLEELLKKHSEFVRLYPEE